MRLFKNNNNNNKINSCLWGVGPNKKEKEKEGDKLTQDLIIVGIEKKNKC